MVYRVCFRHPYSMITKTIRGEMRVDDTVLLSHVPQETVQNNFESFVVQKIMEMKSCTVNYHLYIHLDAIKWGNFEKNKSWVL